ncbi:DMP19 family protein [Moraxella oblonga]|uniref:DMP19 family protein n=1 Tax=Moraxella oblonga TaxID=200413 RepID=UPI0008329BA5|nr:DUF4375 domain-containing protein [Moraxella oblonga]
MRETINKTMNETFIKPRTYKMSYYLQNDWYFHNAVFFFLNKEMDEKEYLPKLPPVLKTLCLFPRVAGQISNGGFSQLYFNGYDDAVKGCLEGLYEVGANKMADILRFTYAQYVISDNRREELDFSNFADFDEINRVMHQTYSNFDQKMSQTYQDWGMDLEEMQRYVWHHDKAVMAQIVAYIKANPNLYLVDEYGKPFDENFTGVYEYYDDKQGYVLTMQNGKPHGTFKMFDYTTEGYSTTIDDVGEFEQGFLTKRQYKLVWNKDENKPYTQYFYEYHRQGDDVITTEIECFKNSQQPKELSHYLNGDICAWVGERKHWHENGQLKEVRIYERHNNSSKTLNVKTYYENGQLEREWREDDTWVSFYDNGQKKRELFGVDDEKHDIARWWHADGSLAGETVLDENGKFVKYHCFYPNGVKSIEFTFVKEGYNEDIIPQNAWDEQGNQIIKNGTGVIDHLPITDCKWVHFYDKTVAYQDGLMHGRCVQGRFDGGKEVVEYEHGKKIKTQIFDKEGNLTDSW